MLTDIKLIDYLKIRRSTPVLQLSEPGPSQQELQDILTLAVRVPDHGKLAPWRFVVMQGAARARIGEACLQRALEKSPELTVEQQTIERGRFERAPVVIAVISKPVTHFKVPEWEQYLSAGALCLNLMMAVNANGFAANWITEWVAFDQSFLVAIGVQSEEKIAGFIHVGSTDFPAVERPRPELETVVTWLGEN